MRPDPGAFSGKVAPGFPWKMRPGLTPRRAFDLRVHRLGHLVQPLAVGLAVDHIGDVAVRPVERADLAVVVVAQRAVRPAGARAVEREALAGLALVHEE